MRIFTTLGLLLALTALVFAQNEPANSSRQQLTSSGATKEFTERFLNVLVKGRAYDAFALMKSANPESEAEIETTRGTTEELLREVSQSYGRPINFELLDTKTLGKSFVRYDYLVKFERNALHCRVVYYQPNQTWIPVNLVFSSDMGQLFYDLGK